jgi:hypothetical protein
MTEINGSSIPCENPEIATIKTRIRNRLCSIFVKVLIKSTRSNEI